MTCWYELVVQVPPEHGEAVANFLIEEGAPGVQLDETAELTAITAHFSEPPPIEAVWRYCAAVSAQHHDGSRIAVHTRQIAEEDWAENWKLHSRPQFVGDHLYVCPSWAATPPPGRLAIIIDPGMAFGTGQHATTRGCLRLLERRVQSRRVARALDVGTGSGVLAIALAKLGVGAVVAVDNDPQARTVAAANAALNDVSPRTQMAASLDAAAGLFDLVVANLFADLLEQLATSLLDRLDPQGTLICSGFLVHDEARVSAAFEARGLTLAARDAEDGWVTLALERQGPL